MSDTHPDPFTQLGLPVRIPVDKHELRGAWLTKSNALHPDRASDRIAATAQLALVNEAKKVLEDRFLAAVAMIAAVGGAEIAGSNQLPPESAMRMLEVRDELERAIELADESAGMRIAEHALAEEQAVLDFVEEQLADSGVPECTLRECQERLNTVPAQRRVLSTLRDAGLIGHLSQDRLPRTAE